jgi:hypothetical protein
MFSAFVLKIYLTYKFNWGHLLLLPAIYGSFAITITLIVSFPYYGVFIAIPIFFALPSLTYWWVKKRFGFVRRKAPSTTLPSKKVIYWARIGYGIVSFGLISIVLLLPEYALYSLFVLFVIILFLPQWFQFRFNKQVFSDYKDIEVNYDNTED